MRRFRKSSACVAIVCWWSGSVNLVNRVAYAGVWRGFFAAKGGVLGDA